MMSTIEKRKGKEREGKRSEEMKGKERKGKRSEEDTDKGKEMRMQDTK